MVYETQRLHARELTAEDLPVLRRMLQNPHVMTAWEYPFCEDEVLAWLDRQLHRYRTDGYGLWALTRRENGEMVGQCGLTWQDLAGTPVLEIGYMFLPEYWHQGYAIEAAAGSKNYAFDHLGAQEVYSLIRDNNIASMNVAIRNGMLVRRRFVKHYRGVDMPHLAFSVRADQC